MTCNEMDNPITFIRYSASLNRLHFFKIKDTIDPAKMDEVRFSPYNLTKAKKNLEEIQNQTAIGKIEKRSKYLEMSVNVCKCL